ncbi:PhzF family phenazine biosynthesis protein [Roseivirga sp.]|uniref:PhzF family phenazine biosynthesis protein n=1 Tax=Roseivirga sp. TaxID=1964215 RepID=UPI002B2665FF|nr:PhzF family phenazine biosynthesis protein [Roseivirga sp.]
MKIYQVDSFTKEIFKGNPAAVAIMDQPLTGEMMQKIAVEMNLSETAFVKINEDYCDLRWFTPATEVPLCGHATLASAFALWQGGHWPKNKRIEFKTLSGSLFTSLDSSGLITMDFPANYATIAEGFDKTELESAFGFPIKEVLNYPAELILIFESEGAVLSANPDDAIVAKQAKNGVIISALSKGTKYDFVSRYFGPNLGIKEDPVTGFMHTILTPYWANKTGKTSFKAFQASARTGEMQTELKGKRVILKGNAVMVFETEFKLSSTLQ